MRNSLIDRVEQALTKLRYTEEARRKLAESQEETITGLQSTLKAQEVIRSAAKVVQTGLSQHLSGIVTKAIRNVIEKPYEFHIEFVERRGVVEADIFVSLYDNRLQILDSAGGGLADVCSFTLKVAYLLLSNRERVIVIDEIARHINSREQREAFASVVKSLCKEFDIQVIAVTAVEEFIEVANQVITVSQKDGVSTIKNEALK